MSSPRSKTRTALYRLARQTSTRGATGNTRGASSFFLSWSRREKSRLALARRFLSQLIFFISNHSWRGCRYSQRELIATRLVLLAAREGLLCLELFSSAPETLFGVGLDPRCYSNSSKNFAAAGRLRLPSARTSSNMIIHRILAKHDQILTK